VGLIDENLVQLSLPLILPNPLKYCTFNIANFCLDAAYVDVVKTNIVEYSET
jgi:hypothetical protein